MFVKRNTTRLNGKTYSSTLLVEGVRVPGKRPQGRPAAQAQPPKSRIIHRTLANLSKLPPELIAVIEAHCKGLSAPPSCPEGPSVGGGGDSSPGGNGPPSVHVGPCYGLLAALHALARQLGIVKAVGEQSRTQRLALYLVYARLCHQGSRLSAARWSEDHAVREILGVGAFDEDDLYEALEYLAEHQSEIEAALASRQPAGSKEGPQAIFMYDVTSVYFEGQHNELAQFGYNRDGKKGKKQMVAGLLTDAQGHPLSIQLYPGNTSDPPTFLDAVEKLKVRFGAREIALVGDRGMIKALGKQALGEACFRYVSALTDPQIRVMLRKGQLQMELFEDKPAEVQIDSRRYIVRCNAQTKAREVARREDQWAKVRQKMEARNAQSQQQPLCKASTSLSQAQGWLKKYRLNSWVSVRLEGSQLVWKEDPAARALAAELDGCYVVETDLPEVISNTQEVHDRYIDLTQVERDFRTLKTGLLEIRPVFLRKASRTRGHAVVSLLALMLARELDKLVAPLGLTVQDAVEVLKGVRLVSLQEPSQGLWHLAQSYPAAQTQLLEVLPKFPPPMLSLVKTNSRRLNNPRKGRQ
jgi:transposase